MDPAFRLANACLRFKHESFQGAVQDVRAQLGIAIWYIGLLKSLYNVHAFRDSEIIREI
jgi:hypothetical protein